MTRAVQNLRRAYEEYMGGMEAEPSEEEKRKVMTGLCPEYVLPYALALLAHFPDFPTGPDDTPRWRALAK